MKVFDRLNKGEELSNGRKGEGGRPQRPRKVKNKGKRFVMITWERFFVDLAKE